MTATMPRRRLTPEIRRENILDVAARIVLEEGVSAVSMERLGREAGVSKALVYAYFDSQTDVLSALLMREHRHFQAKGRKLLAQSEGFAAGVRATTAAWLDHVAERGGLIERLTNEPDIARIMESVDATERPMTSAIFGDGIAREYRIDRTRATTIADLLMGLTGAAGAQIHRTGADRTATLELTLTMIFAVLTDIASDDKTIA